MAQSQPWQWIPTNLTLEQFEEFVLPHLPKGISDRLKLCTFCQYCQGMRKKDTENNNRWLGESLATRDSPRHLIIIINNGEKIQLGTVFANLE